MTRIVTTDGFGPDPLAHLTPVPLDSYGDGGALLLAVDDDLSEVARHFASLELIVVPFASSADGRGFSLAADLRALGYLGHLRARGHVLVDQFRAALRCGFDDVEISAEQAARNPESQWRAIAMTPGYRSAVFGAPSDALPRPHARLAEG